MLERVGRPERRVSLAVVVGRASACSCCRADETASREDCSFRAAAAGSTTGLAGSAVLTCAAAASTGTEDGSDLAGADGADGGVAGRGCAVGASAQGSERG